MCTCDGCAQAQFLMFIISINHCNILDGGVMRYIVTAAGVCGLLLLYKPAVVDLYYRRETGYKNGFYVCALPKRACVNRPFLLCGRCWMVRFDQNVLERVLVQTRDVN